MNKKEFIKIYREYSHRVMTTKVVMALASSADHIIAATFISSTVLAAITLINPMLFFIFAFAFMFASGLGSYIGLLMGKKEIDIIGSNINKIHGNVQAGFKWVCELDNCVFNSAIRARVNVKKLTTPL